MLCRVAALNVPPYIIHSADYISLWSFEISEDISRNQKIIICLDAFCNQHLIYLPPLDNTSLCIYPFEMYNITVFLKDLRFDFYLTRVLFKFFRPMTKLAKSDPGQFIMCSLSLSQIDIHLGMHRDLGLHFRKR